MHQKPTTRNFSAIGFPMPFGLKLTLFPPRERHNSSARSRWRHRSTAKAEARPLRLYWVFPGVSEKKDNDPDCDKQRDHWRRAHRL